MIAKEKYADNYTNYNKQKSLHVYPKNNKEIFKCIDYANKKKIKILTVGSSLSWHDTIQNKKNLIINLKNYHKRIEFNSSEGIASITGSFTIKEILKITQPKGWTLYSIPGTSDVTIGGCISNDVHGKDSFKYGNFSENILSMDIITSNKKVLNISRIKNYELFKTISGGLGLIGVIIGATIKLKKFYPMYVKEVNKCDSYKEVIKALYLNRDKYDYIFGWVDSYSKKNIGRGIVYKAKIYENSRKILNLNFSNYLKKIIFNFAIKYKLFKYLNFLFWHSHIFKKKNEIDTYEKIVFPLSGMDISIKSSLKKFNFLEVQIIINKKFLPHGLREFLIKCQELKLDGFIVGIKMHKKNKNLISFADDGISININYVFNEKNENSALEKIRNLQNFTIKKGYKIYLCKDALLKKKQICKIYKRFPLFLKRKKKHDDNNLFFSDFLRRI
jgi:hypothetical protein